MNDITLLTLLGNDKVYFERFKPYVKEYALSSDCWEIYKTLGEYYASYPGTVKVDWNDFTTFFFMVKGKVKPEKALIYRTILEKIAATSITGKEELYKDLVAHYVKLDYATRIGNVAIKVAGDGKGDIDEIEDLIQSYRKEVGRSITKEDLFVPSSLTEIVKAVSAIGFEWRLEELNLSLGPLRPGDFIIVGARPEVGKTTLLAQEVSYFATQLKDDNRPIIWVNNEERSQKVMFRIIQSHFGVVTSDVLKNAASYEARFNAEIGRRILVLNDDAGIRSTRQLDSLFIEHNPVLIVFDQLDKVWGFDKEEREDLRLGKLYAWARDKAKEYGPVISISQVAGRGEGKEYIEQDDLRGTTTDKQGEADAIVTIGRSVDPAKGSARYIYVPKNKLHGGPRSKEEFRHGRFEVRIRPEIARYETSVTTKTKGIASGAVI